jgi:vacuolar-type H+-ATPase catalytic subunit A/Vma1
VKNLRGGLLMDQAVAICDTSSRPVPACETSIHMGITLGAQDRRREVVP